MSNKKILSGITYGWLRLILGFFIAIIQTPLLFKYLEKQELGVWYLFFSLAAFIQMTDFGLPSAVSRAVAYINKGCKISEQPEVKFYMNYSVSDVYKSALISFSFLSAFVVITGSLLINIYKPNFGVTPNLSHNVNMAFSIYLAGVFFNMTANIPNACLSGLGDVGYDSLIIIFVQIIGLILILIFLPIYSSIILLAIIYLVQGIITTFVVHFFITIRYNYIFNSDGQIIFILIKRLYNESFYLFLNQIGGWLTNQSGIWVAMFVLGADLIADYSVTLQLIFYGLSISMSIPIAINPYAASAFSLNGVQNVHKYFFFALKTSTFIVGFWIIILSVWGKSILILWIGENHFLGYWVLIPLLINMFLEMQHSINGGFVWNTGKWPFVPTTISAGILNVIFCLIGCYYFGYKGLAFGTMIAKLLTLNWYVVFYALRRLNISIKKYLIEYLYPSTSILIILIPLLYLFNNQVLKIHMEFLFLGQPGIIIVSLIIGAFVSLIIFGLLYYIFAIDKLEKQLLISFLQKLKEI